MFIVGAQSFNIFQKSQKKRNIPMSKVMKTDLAGIVPGTLQDGKHHRISSKVHGIHSPVLKSRKSGGYSIVGHKGADLTVADIDVAAAAIKQDLGLTTADTTQAV